MEFSEINNFPAYIVTLGVAILIGILLSHFSQNSTAVKPGAESPEGTIRGSNRPLPRDLQQELDQLPANRRKQLSAKISGFVEERVQTEVGATREELSRQYDKAAQLYKGELGLVEQKYQQAAAQQKQTESVLRSIAEGLVVVNPRGEVVYINPAAEKLLGVNQQQKLGKPLAENMADEQLLALVKDPLAAKNAGETEIELNSKQDQTKRIVRSSNAVIQDQSGQTVGMVSVLSDITKQRELDRLKADFVSSVTHELRTPLVAMQHSLQVTLDESTGQLSKDQRNFLSIAQRNLERLSSMINNLLDLSKLENRKVELKLERVQLESLIQNTCLSLDAWAKSKSVQLHQRVGQPPPEAVIDSDQITQVLYNLISNAVKFTPAGGSVTVSAKRLADGKAVEVAVTDTGIGIAREDIPKLFKKFQQVGDPRGGTGHGTGLGLAISKGIVELHGGSILVESSKGQGSRFVFTLPVAPEGAA